MAPVVVSRETGEIAARAVPCLDRPQGSAHGRLGRRDIRALEDLATVPGGAQHREQVAIESPVACNFPGEDEEDAQSKEDRVRAGRASELEAEVHDRSEESGETNQRANQET